MSLTQASSISIAGTNKATDKNNPTTDSIQEQMAQLQPQIDALNNDVNSLNAKSKRFKRIWYKPWYWGEAGTILKDMGIIIYNMHDRSDKLQVISEKIHLESEKLKAEDQQKSSEENTTPSYIEIAESMSKKLEEVLHVTFTAAPAADLKVGDVVQYKSQNKYYIYLKVLRATG